MAGPSWFAVPSPSVLGLHPGHQLFLNSAELAFKLFLLHVPSDSPEDKVQETVIKANLVMNDINRSCTTKPRVSYLLALCQVS